MADRAILGGVKSARATTRSSRGRLGRPPSADSLETRQRILDLARQEFAVHGYEATTNRRIAARVGITTAALYHYFPSKSDLYVAVATAAEARVLSRFEAVTASGESLVESLQQVLDESHAMNSEDPSLALILAAFRIDERRHPEVREAMRGQERLMQGFFRNLVDRAIDTGEIDRADRTSVLALVTVLLVGLSDAMSDDLRSHRIGVEAAKSLLGGRIPLGETLDR